ncbi:MAG TPA: peptidase M61, partial [Bacteroidia bacterium]|nr:peptidase M61 [Bacteroidia bacterium]
ELFDQIVKLTYPEIGDFFKNYVEGNKPLPLKETLRLVGIGYGTTSLEKNISIGGISIGLNNASGKLMLVNTASMDDFGKIMGYMEYDELIKFNGKKVSAKNIQVVIDDFVKNAKEGDVLVVVVSRKKSETSKAKKVKLKSKLIPVLPPATNNLILLPDASDAQLKLRTEWIGKH